MVFSQINFESMNKLLGTVSMIFFLGFPSLSQDKISVEPRPVSIYIEQGENKQSLNFDFLVKNNSADTLKLSKVSVFVYDQKNHIIHSRFLDNNGTAPSIHTIPDREFKGKETKLIFNPFTEFDLTMTLGKMMFELIFSNNKNEEFIVKTAISPKKYYQMEKYAFPLSGKILVYDGHDFYAHHRRFDYEFSIIKQLGISANFMRYGYDFVILDSAHNQFKGSADSAENYFGFGKKVNAIAAGKVIYASNKHKDDKSFDIPGIANNPLELYGNCIAIEHKNGAISIYGHLKQNSLKIKVGDKVSIKQEIASIGISGSSFFPHLHFEMRSSIKASAEGFPSYFSDVILVDGNTNRKLKSGLVETGNLIEVK